MKRKIVRVFLGICLVASVVGFLWTIRDEPQITIWMGLVTLALILQWGILGKLLVERWFIK